MVLGSKKFDLHWLTDQVIIHLLPNVSLEGRPMTLICPSSSSDTSVPLDAFSFDEFDTPPWAYESVFL